MTGLLELILFLGFLYWFFDGRLPECASTMIDVISAHFSDAYANIRPRSWVEGGGGGGGGMRPTDFSLRRTIYQQRKKLLQDRDQIKLAKERSLYQLKETSSKLAMVPLRKPFVGLACERCTPNSNNSLVNKVSKNTNVINLLRVGYKENCERGFFSRTFCDVSHILRSKKFDYVQVAELVMSDDRLKQALQQVTQEAIDKEQQESDKKTEAIQDSATLESHQVYKSNEKRARSILTNMRSTLNVFLLRLTCWTLIKLFPYFVSSIVTSPTQIEMLKQAGESGLPLIFIPLHRSHLDYILVSFILVNYNIRSPLVAAGDNLKIPFFGWLLRGLGAFYIKRRLESGGGDRDIVYRATLHTYMMHCLRARHNVEFFIEGGRSRTGKPQLPKGGILSVILDAYLDGTIADALLIPMSINYEKLVDGNFVREQLGMPKKMESFGAASKAIWSVLNSHYGSIRADFNQPFSMRELVRSFNQIASINSKVSLTRSISFDTPSYQSTVSKDSITIQKLSRERTLTSNPSCISLYGTDCVVEDQRRLVEAISRHIVYDCTKITPIMSTNVLAFVMLTRYRGGCSLSQVVIAVDNLTKELINSGKDMGYIGDTVDVVNHAINILGPGLVLKEYEAGNIIVKPVSILPNIIELSYYSNCLMPYYALQSITVTALQVLINESPNEAQVSVSYEELMDMSLQLCEVMSQEFILCKPCQSLEDVVSEAIHTLCHKEWITVSKSKMYTDDQMHSIRLSHTVDGEDHQEMRPSYTLYHVNQDDIIIEERQYLQTVLRPLIDAYSVTIQCLPKLITENGFTSDVSESEFVQDILTELKSMLDRGDCKYGEALSMDAIKNCLRLLRMWGVLDVYTEGKIRWLMLTNQYNNPTKLKDIHNLIVRFRTETEHEESISKIQR